MKHKFIILTIICFSSFLNAQNRNYNSDWQAVEKLESEGLTKSASKKVEAIYAKAKAEKNTTQIVKSLLFQSKYLQVLEEDSQLKIVNTFKAEIEAHDIVTQHVLQNLLAKLYWQYYQSNRYKFYNRSKTAAKVDDDFRTWDLQTLFKEVHCYYHASLEDETLLQQESLEKYDALLNTIDGSKIYRSTLFDFLSYNALEFYKTSENGLTQPAYKFVIDDEKYIATNDVFSNLKLTSKDSVNLQLNALKIYQNLLRFHQKDKTSKAFILANVLRLNFVKQHATFNDKDQKLISTLKEEIGRIKSHQNSNVYNYEIAKLWINEASKYNPNDESTQKYRWKAKDALELCKAIIFAYPKSDDAFKFEVLQEQILNPSLSLKTEKHIPINKESLVLVNYKNLENLEFKTYKITTSQQYDFYRLYQHEEKLNFLNKLKVHNSFNSQLKNGNDYQNHSAEVIIPPYENGVYLVAAFAKNDVFSTATVQVTNMALVESQENDKVTYQVINRTNGQPIEGVKATLNYSEGYNRNNRRKKTFTSDNQGKFHFNKDGKSYYDVSVELKNDNENAVFGNSYINRKYYRNPNTAPNYRTHLITDRSIYRPGQTVYFKGIATKTENTNTTVVSDADVTAILNDVNGQELNKLEFKTNEYGSFHGEFILPNSGLTGNFSIRTNSDIFGGSSTSISVEEYKRPKFETQFLPVTDTYKVNDSVTVKGNAIAFAGSNITNAKVIYRVKRNVQLPRWYYWRRPSYNSNAQEISYGEIKTDAKGEFEITFKAQPDESVSKDNLPVFNYEITADVTDINGETRSAATTVRVGYHALTANINAPQRIDKAEKETTITINTTNLNGEFVPAKGVLKIYKLESPDVVLRQRPWQAPDYKLLSQSEFKTKFPHWSYDNEHLIQNWEKEDPIFTTDFDTEKSKDITLKRIKKWKTGAYLIVLETKDKFGQDVKDQAYTFLNSDDDKTIADNKLFDINLNKDSYETNDTAILTFGSAAENLTVTVDIEKQGEIIDTQIHKLSNNKKQIELPITKEDVGGFVIHYSFSAYNDFTSSSVKVNVPYPKTDLQIETSTFRDKLQPGQDETWSFKIKGPKGDKVAAEVLASMYDVSLDEFKPNDWNFNPINRPNYYSRINKNSSRSFGIDNFRNANYFRTTKSYAPQAFDSWNWFGFYFGRNYRYKILSGMALGIETESKTEAAMVLSENVTLEDSIVYMKDARFADGDIKSKDAEYQFISDKIKLVPGDLNVVGASNMDIYGIPKNEIQIRKNLQETAFFFPQLQTDKDGNVSFNFKAPEALTKWKLQLLAHTKTLESTVSQFEAVTQKELMVLPNTPRFLRQGDEIVISTKISNLTDKSLSGKAELILEDATTGEDISQNILIPDMNYIGVQRQNPKVFTVDAKGNTSVMWNLTIPEEIQAIQYKIIARSEDFSDGEQNVLPVLTNRMLVTETLPMWVRSNETKTFTLDKLYNLKDTLVAEALEATNTKDTSRTSVSSLKNHKLTLEITSNPAWYAVQALPYLMEYPYDCNEQTFSRYYANALAQYITKSNPRIEEVFNQWKSTNSDALISNLEKNQELKSLLIEETPWLRDAQSETEQKKRIALLFDLNKMNNELQGALRKLKNNQYDSGAWPWFNGGRDNRYITQHIVSGFGHLKKLGVDSDQNEMIEKALEYLDKEFVKEYKDLTKYNSKIDLSKDHLSYTQLHYLYVRSFYPELKASNEVNKIIEYYESQIEKYWLKRSLYAKGLMALTMHRNGNDKTAGKILKSLEENSITSEELGMYWKENTASWYWHQAPIETQALMIEAFSEVGSVILSETKNLETIDNLKIWLLKNKQTNKWETTKATSEAVYALLLQGSEWLSVTEAVDVTVGNESISPSKLENVKVEAGTGYYKTSWNGSEIKPEQAKVTLTKKGKGIAWGALYWQYFEDLDKITSAETPLKLKKKLFLKKNTDTGEEISEITTDTKLNVGDLVKVRIELRSDRDMEFLHLKDMRAAGFEPINVLSKYKWQDGLGYYESTKDAATNFFIDYLPKGIYVFEYDLRVNNSGNMSNGITTIQSMYAPEFSSHSEGIRVTVE